jgi:hypothetical protein
MGPAVPACRQASYYYDRPLRSIHLSVLDSAISVAFYRDTEFVEVDGLHSSSPCLLWAMKLISIGTSILVSDVNDLKTRLLLSLNKRS